jgi:hypothetical protein
MSEYTETDFSVDKKDVIQMCERITKFLMKDFDKKFNQHKSLDHKWFVQGTIHGVCRGLFVDKQVAIYLILGSNPRRPGWGELKKKYDIEPVKFVLRREVVAAGKKLLENHGFKVFFTDVNRNGDFNMKVIFYPYTQEGEEVKASASSSEEGKASSEEGFVTVGKKKSLNNKSKTTGPAASKPVTSSGYAGAAYRGKDKPAPAPLADPKKKAVLPKKTIVLDSDSEESVTAGAEDAGSFEGDKSE